MAPPRKKSATTSAKSKTKAKQNLPSLFSSDAPPPTPKLTNLPPELQINIADYLIKYQDLKNVCLACKDLQALVTPYLYRTMVLRQAQITDKLKASLHAQNHGLKHLRRLSIVTCHHLPKAYVNGELFEILCYLLNVIPRDTLEVFDLTGHKEVARDLVYLIRVRQQRLTTHQFHPIDGPAIRTLPAADEFAHVTTLQLFLAKFTDCEDASIMLARSPKLSSLALELQQQHLPSGGGNNETGTRVVEKLLDQFTKLGGHSPRAKLKRLRISRMCFEDAGTTLPTLLDCTDLKHLQLVDCSETGPLFESLIQLKLGLDSLIVERADDDDTDSNGMTDMLLRSLHPVERLRFTRVYTSETHGDFAWDTIKQHGGSLRALEVEDIDALEPPFRGHQDHDRSLAGFRDLCKSLTKLRQISLTSPYIEPTHWSNAGGLDDFLSCLANLHDLRTLKLYAWPDSLGEDEVGVTCDGCGRDRLREQIYETKERVQTLANKIFTTLSPSCPNLVALVIECWRVSDEDGPQECETFAFMRSMQTDCYRRITWVGVDTPLSEIKHHEPCSDILEEERFLVL